MSPLLPLVLLLGLTTPARAAERADTIQRRLSDDDYDGARSRCERWEAWTTAAEPDLREACAKAYWPLAEARDSAEGWAAYRDRWQGTEWAEVAREREAEAALRELPSEATEEVLLTLADDFAGTRASLEATQMAAEAAIRDVDSPESAVRAARRYPRHASLPAFVERYPDAFVSVHLLADPPAAPADIQVTLDPPVSLPAYMTPAPVWVARWPGGHAEPWREVAARHLAEAGLPADRIRPTGDRQAGGPGLPLCALPGQPEGWHAAVEVRLGAGRVYRPVAWQPGCGPDALPIALGVSGGQVAGLSLAPGQLVDLTARLTADRPNVRDYLPAPPSGDPLFSGAQVYLPAGRVFLVYPLGGGPPWLTDRAPAPDPIALPAALIGSPPPRGYTLAADAGGALVLRSAAGAEWRMPPGEVRFLSPLVQRALGIDPALAAALPAGAPPLPAGLAWSRPLRPEPPGGASPAPSRPLPPEELRGALLRVASAGLDLEAVEALDGVAVDLDGDGEEEVVIRARVGGRGTLLCLDVDPALGNRLFATESRVVPAAGGGGGSGGVPPSAFGVGGHTYLAWPGPASTGEHLVEIVRHDGQSLRVELLRVPR